MQDGKVQVSKWEKKSAVKHQTTSKHFLGTYRGWESWLYRHTLSESFKILWAGGHFLHPLLYGWRCRDSEICKLLALTELWKQQSSDSDLGLWISTTFAVPSP